MLDILVAIVIVSLKSPLIPYKDAILLFFQLYSF